MEAEKRRSDKRGKTKERFDVILEGETKGVRCQIVTALRLVYMQKNNHALTNGPNYNLTLGR